MSARPPIEPSRTSEPRILVCLDCLSAEVAGGAPDEAVEDFRALHAGHVLEPGIPRGPVLTSGPLWDPASPTFQEIEAAGRTWVLRSERASIEEPRRFSLTAARIERDPPLVEVEAAHLLAVLDRAFYPQTFPERKARKVLRVLEETLARTPPDELLPSHDCPEDAETSYASLPEHLWRRVRSGLLGELDPSEIERVREILFGRANGLPFFVELRTRFRVEPSVD
ncbi:MAG: hypothetical protein KatS3mg076_0474 [Candidatus Binatia bacterium]|nr:MAG: hypothetical protein KatS3mg076_0474 [Candidatus Binatia bacterium]